jgi:hypothetical protein
MKNTFSVLLYAALGTLIACTGQYLDKTGDPSKASVISLTRVSQRVIRYDCNGRMTSDMTETVGSPTQLVTIQPRTRTNLETSSFSNLTMGTKANCIFDVGNFYVDYYDGWCSMRVGSGKNEIRYSFTYCDQSTTRYDGNGNPVQDCTSRSYETGTTWIDVSYSEDFRSGTQEIRPSAESCQH